LIPISFHKAHIHFIHTRLIVTLVHLARSALEVLFHRITIVDAVQRFLVTFLAHLLAHFGTGLTAISSRNSMNTTACLHTVGSLVRFVSQTIQQRATTGNVASLSTWTEAHYITARYQTRAEAEEEEKV
jgi:uncharacterized membrane protein YGL010W